MEQNKEVTEKKLRKRRIRGSGITRKIPIEEVITIEDDDDPFVDCDSQRWSLKTALEHINKFDTKKVNFNIAGYKGPLTGDTFDFFSNTLVICLFRMYAKLETELQNSLRIFYFGLEKSNLPRFRNITYSLHKQNTFHRYPWLTTDEKLREPVDVKEVYKKRRNRGKNESKPFSEACKQYEIEKRKSSKMQKIPEVHIEPEPFDNALIQNACLHDINIINTTPENFTNNNVNTAELEMPFNQNDQHVLLSQEYNNMISAINSNYQYNLDVDEKNESNETEILAETSKRKRKKRSRWSSPPIASDIVNAEIPTSTNTKKIKTIKLSLIKHFENRKIKLITQTPLSLGDLIVLVSYFYKLGYMEQQLLIEKMKVLEATKPNQAAYLRQYVRTECPLYDDNEIVFKPLPEQLISSEINTDLNNVTSIEDILEKDFCVSDDNSHEEEEEERIKIENASHDCADDIKQEQASKEFDFGSAFL